jgi:hypothetical protein
MAKRYVNVVCYDYQVDSGAGTGKPFVLFSLRVVDGPEAGTDFRERGYLTDKAAPYTFRSMRALGWTGTKPSRAMSDGLGTRKAQARIEPEEYNGKVRDRVTGIFELKPRGTKNPVSAENIDAFDALFEDVAAGVAGCESELSDFNKAPATLPEAAPAAASPVKVNPNELGF